MLLKIFKITIYMKPLQAVRVLNEYKKLVWPEVRKYLRDPRYPRPFEVDQKYQKIKDFYWQLNSDYPKRQGKYLRPTLLVLAAEAMGVKREKAVPAAAAMQISEEWLLVHDDLQDDSLYRRGAPTLHQIYGKELAVNAGNALHEVMWKVILDNNKLLGKKKANEIGQEFYRMLMRTILGQAVEIKWTRENNLKFTEADYFFVVDGKTSYYSIAGPLRLGAIIAGATSRQLDFISKFGIKLGRCFQLVDDILDLTSDFAGLKKQTGNDIYEGKRTLILSHLVKKTNKKEKAKITKIMAKPRERKTAREVAWFLQLMEQKGSIEHARKVARRLEKESLEIFNRELQFFSREPARSKLESLIHFVLERDR